MEFKPWPKITRIENKRKPIFTEKIDGTNSCIVIQDGNIWCQSRNRFITPDDDNYGFAGWVHRNKEEILQLGNGHHFGEWWGLGIGRVYDQPVKRFSLFNTRRWTEIHQLPAIISVVPILPVSTVEEARQYLIDNGSVVAPGFKRPEGAVMYEPDTDTCFKIIIDK